LQKTYVIDLEMKFKDFPIEPELKKSLQSMGFRKPTDIQYKSIPPILRGEDVLAVAQTGTGKTAAFAIPVINLLHRRKRSRRSEGVRCVVMVPTHELATQLTDVFQEIGKHSKVKTFGIFGGVEQDPQIAQLQRGIDVLVATPGRLFDLASQGHLDLRQVEILILDEADRMLALGFYKDIQDLIKKLPRKRQTLFFSATIDKKIKKLAYALVNSKAIRIQISPEDPVSKNVEHSVFFAEMDEKRFFLERLVKEQEGKKILVFVRTKVRAERVVKAMERVKIESKSLHGDKDQKDRQAVLDSFREGKLKLLIATDVSARGIDIPGWTSWSTTTCLSKAKTTCTGWAAPAGGATKDKPSPFVAPESRSCSSRSSNTSVSPSTAWSSAPPKEKKPICSSATVAPTGAS
jgi:ATP-dependent RNA helicase RhlE